MTSGHPPEVFVALERAKQPIVERLAVHGVIGTEYVVGFVRPYSIWVWLVTATDAERDGLPVSSPFLAEVRAAVRAAGLTAVGASVDGTAAQSQETVDRDYEGSWFYALR